MFTTITLKPFSDMNSGHFLDFVFHIWSQTHSQQQEKVRNIQGWRLVWAAGDRTWRVAVFLFPAHRHCVGPLSLKALESHRPYKLTCLLCLFLSITCLKCYWHAHLLTETIARCILTWVCMLYTRFITDSDICFLTYGPSGACLKAASGTCCNDSARKEW